MRGIGAHCAGSSSLCLATSSAKAPPAAHVNLIPLNHVDERSFEPSTPERLAEFKAELERAGVNVTVRRKLGGDIDASCGQLRKKAAGIKDPGEGQHPGDGA